MIFSCAAVLMQFFMRILNIAVIAADFMCKHLGSPILLSSLLDSNVYKASSYVVILGLQLRNVQCVALPIASSLQGGPFWAVLTASVSMSLWDLRSSRTVFIQVVQGRPGGLFHSSTVDVIKMFLALELSSICVMCPIRERRHAYMVEARKGCSDNCAPGKTGKLSGNSAIALHKSGGSGQCFGWFQI